MALPVENFEYRNGLLWLPVRSGSNNIIQPLYNRGDTGSLMPYISLRIPDLFNYLVLPYENILNFEYTPLGGLGKASLTLVDSTPIFIETIIREALNRRDENNYRLFLDFGWRVQNPTEAVRDFVIGSDESGLEAGVFSNGETPFFVDNATYTYSTHGILINLELIADPVNLLEKYTVEKKTTVDTSRLTNRLGFEQEISTFLNNIVTKREEDVDFRIIVRSSAIRYDKLVFNEIAFKSSDSLETAIEKIVKKLYVPAASQQPEGGRVQFFISHRPQTEQSLGISQDSNKRVLPVFIYVQEEEIQDQLAVPLIEYPSNETPITNFQPELSMPDFWLEEDSYRTIDTQGNQRTEFLRQKAINAGINSLKDGQTVTANTEDQPNDEVLAIEKSRSAGASVNITMLGDPTFASENLLYTIMDIKMTEIVSQGILRDRSDFFGNFPQVPLTTRLLGGQFAEGQNVPEVSNLISERGILPLLEGIPSDISPFNGRYSLMNVTHRISQGDGFVTDMQLEYQFMEAED